MISYEPLWETMRQQRMTTYALIHKHGIPSSTVDSLKHNRNITMLTLEKLCNILGCSADGVVEFKTEDKDI